jgi:uncharacterized protein YdiU (UPF0061 family)
MIWNNLFHSSFNQYQSLFLQEIPPKKLNNATLIAWSESCAKSINVNRHTIDWLNIINGHNLPKEIASCATVYSGHQFGQWAGQLGDGRALLLGSIQVKNTDNSFKTIELQLKGSGRTLYSRGGDGMAVLRSSIREFLCSEAMANLNIATTRSLALVHSEDLVIREQVENAGVVLRTAPSFIRFGHFEHFAVNQNAIALQQLINYVVQNYYPEAAKHPTDSDMRTLVFFDIVCQKTAHLIAQWQAVGFCHGVMNTDNMSILGLTLDYGPFGFLDTFDMNHICNHSDYHGRYAYNKQPKIAQWNLACLAQALSSSLLSTDSHSILNDSLNNFSETFLVSHTNLFLCKLGLSNSLINASEGRIFINKTLDMLHYTKADMTAFFRRLSHWVSNPSPATFSYVTDICINPNHSTLSNWLVEYKLYQEKYLTTGISRFELSQAMLAINPKYILRNYLAEVAIKKASEEQDYSEINTLLTLLEKPFDEQPIYDSYAELPPAWAISLEVSCSS